MKGYIDMDTTLGYLTNSQLVDLKYKVDRELRLSDESIANGLEVKK